MWISVKFQKRFSHITNQDKGQDIQTTSQTQIGGAHKLTRTQTFERFEIKKRKGDKREHSTAVPWSPDLL